MSKRKKRTYKTQHNTQDQSLCGIIRGSDLMKHSRIRVKPVCRTGSYMTEKDRPRKRIRVADLHKYM